MKATLTFNLPEDQSEFNTAVKAMDAKSALWDIAQEIFRPARKHGYSDTDISNLLEMIGEHGHELIGLLETKFYAILSLNGVDISA